MPEKAMTTINGVRVILIKQRILALICRGFFILLTDSFVEMGKVLAKQTPAHRKDESSTLTGALQGAGNAANIVSFVF
jgi:hypothetical protein